MVDSIDPTFGHELKTARRSSCYMLAALKQPGTESLPLAAAYAKTYFPFREVVDFIFKILTEMNWQFGRTARRAVRTPNKALYEDLQNAARSLGP